MRSLLSVLALVALLALPTGAAALGPGDLDSRFGVDGTVFTRLGALTEPGTSVTGARDVASAPRVGLTVAGSAPDRDGARALALVRYRPAGKVDRDFGERGLVVDQIGFGAEPSSAANAVLARTDGGAIVAGTATDADGRTAMVVASYSAGGERLWVTRRQFGEAATASATALDLTEDATGRVLVVGRADSEPFVARLEAATGALDVTFNQTGFVIDPEVRGDPGPGCAFGDAQATAVLTAADGSVTIGGTVARACDGGRSVPVALLRRYDVAGARDPAFPSTAIGLDTITALAPAVFADGVVASGTVREQGVGFAAAARYIGTGLDPDFPGPTGFGPLPGLAARPGAATAVAVSGTQGDLPVAIDLDDPEQPDQVRRLDAGGMLDPDFATTGLAAAGLRSPRAIAVQADGSVVVVGDLPPASGDDAQGFALARLNGGDVASTVSVRGRSRIRRGLLRLRLSCSAGPGCAGVVRGRQVGVTSYELRGGRATAFGVPVRENARDAASLAVVVTNPPAAARRATVTLSRR